MLMTEQDIMSRAEMLRGPMAPLPIPNPSPSRQDADPVNRPLLPSAELLGLPIPEPVRLLVENEDSDAGQAPRNL
jgi:hypothetical protein